MNFGQNGARVPLYYPRCIVCSTPECTRPHRFFTYQGYLDYLKSTTESPAPGREAEKMWSLTKLANDEFGPAHSAARGCIVCLNDGCLKPHRTMTKEGYAKFLRGVGGVESAEEAVYMADKEFGDSWPGNPVGTTKTTGDIAQGDVDDRYGDEKGDQKGIGYTKADGGFEDQKIVFMKEWEDMAFSKDGMGSKDATQRYALARLIKAAFVTVVGPRGETEVMPWSADLRRPEPAPREVAGRGESRPLSQSQSPSLLKSQPPKTSTPLPGTSSETDYATLRS
ncbi:hypothetical protein V493_00442 [Pseudogymnoascus sp. VKM F-4281 (FW-2241)]|nr:hypothetical protein V493_00442 [Pseudogymnoascus sp. VKM F-4281 (FW-2241)]